MISNITFSFNSLFIIISVTIILFPFVFSESDSIDGESACSEAIECVKSNTCARGKCLKTCNSELTPNHNFTKCGKTFGENCNGKDDCIDTLVCLNGFCSCSSASFQIYNSDTRRCETKIGGGCNPAYSFCIEGSHCEIISANSGSNNGRCKCDDGFIENKFDKNCERNHGAVCNYDDGVRCDTSAGLACVNNICACPDDMFVYSSVYERCMGLVGATCASNSYSVETLPCVDNAGCVGEYNYRGLQTSSECQCNNGFKENEKYACE